MAGGCGFSKKLYEAVMDKCGKQTSIIELGCGNGGNLLRFKGWERVGIDPLIKNIYTARLRKINAKFVHGCHEHLKRYKDKRFDVGITLSVLNHIEGVEPVFNNLVRICKNLVLIEPYIKGENRQATRGEIKLWRVTWFHDYENLIRESQNLAYSIESFPLYKTNCGPYYHLIHVVT